MKRKILISTILVLLLGVLTFSMAFAAEGDAMVTVIHGINGTDFGLPEALPVDVCAGGFALIPDFEFRDMVGPVALPAGSYNITVQLAEGIEAGDECLGTTVLDLPGIMVEGGKNYSIIAHVTEGKVAGAGDVLGLGITASVFENDVSPIVPGKVRVTIRHTADAPGVDIPLYRGWRGGRPIVEIPTLSNGEQAGPLDVRPGGYFFSLDVGDTTVLGPSFLEFPDAHKSYIIYAVGTFPGTFEFLLQTIDLVKMVPPMW